MIDPHYKFDDDLKKKAWWDGFVWGYVVMGLVACVLIVSMGSK